MINKLDDFLKKTNILLVEDEENLRQIIAESIKTSVKDIFEACNGKKGLEIFYKEDLDLIITDINMLEMNGLKMIKEVRKVNPSIPVIFLTAYNTDNNILETIKLHSSNLLTKPFDKKQLLTAMKIAIGQILETDSIINLKNDFVYNTRTQELYFKDTLISLSKLEKRLLELFIHNKKHLVTYEMIENYVWQEKGATQDTVRAYIKKLRKKTNLDLFKNIQGLGYLLDI